MFPTEFIDCAERVLSAMRAKRLRLATAESCTGGLVSALLTEIPGSSDVLERGFVTYSDVAKVELLGVPKDVIERHGAVSASVALAMAEGALLRAHADVSVSVTGIAGPGGGSPQKPVGLVYIAVVRRGGEPMAQRMTFGDIGRTAVRLASVGSALSMLEDAVTA